MRASDCRKTLLENEGIRVQKNTAGKWLKTVDESEKEDMRCGNISKVSMIPSVEPNASAKIGR